MSRFCSTRPRPANVTGVMRLRRPPEIFADVVSWGAHYPKPHGPGGGRQRTMLNTVRRALARFGVTDPAQTIRDWVFPVETPEVAKMRTEADPAVTILVASAPRLVAVPHRVVALVSHTGSMRAVLVAYVSNTPGSCGQCTVQHRDAAPALSHWCRIRGSATRRGAWQLATTSAGVSCSHFRTSHSAHRAALDTTIPGS